VIFSKSIFEKSQKLPKNIEKKLEAIHHNNQIIKPINNKFQNILHHFLSVIETDFTKSSFVYESLSIALYKGKVDLIPL